MVNELLSALGSDFEAHRDEGRASGMSSYMRGKFAYFGIPAPEQRAVAKNVLARFPAPSEGELKRIALDCFSRTEREWQYFACDLLARHVKTTSPRFITTVKKLVTTRSWWDTVDSLASRTVGPLVRTHPGLAETMDRWIDDRNIWVVRTAILHQLGYKKDTDADRLFRYCERQAGQKEFFVRKAIGWALREYSKTDERAVRSFVRTHSDVLSGLSSREALKWLERRA